MSLQIAMIRPDDPRVKRLIELILKWNAKMNITSLEDEREIFDELIFDSAAAGWLIKDIEPPCLDAGCGAGFPTVPIKLVRPELFFYSVDSSRKKINFLRNAVRELGLSGIEIIHDRLENRTELLGRIKTAFSKAFLPPEEALEFLIPFLDEKGKIVIYCSEETVKKAEKKAKEMNLKHQVLPYRLFFSRKERFLFVAEKGGRNGD